MEWNWQQKDWLKFTYKTEPIKRFEEQLLVGNGLLLGLVKHLPEDEKNTLKVDIISNEALKTSEIEGEYLNRDSLQSSIRRHFGLKTDGRNVPPAEKGIADMMTDLYDNYDQRLTHKMLHRWHEMAMTGRTDLRDKGSYRKSKDPMQVVSGPVHKPKIHFEAPPSGQVPSEMGNFTKWFNDFSPKGKSPLSAVTRAGIAHLYFVSIHPFEDGNGRIGRAIAEKALAQCLGQPSLIALSTFIQENRKDYYNALEKANKKNEITQWLVHFGTSVTGAQKYSQKWVGFLVKKTKMFDRLKGQLNKRQEKALLRIFKEGPKGFKGGMSARNYIGITKATAPTATRDLRDLVQKEALIMKGERRYARYYLRVEDGTT